jgi:HEAT repeat protein
MASFHHSGYVREEAVKRLNRITTGIEIPFLLIRLDDWVSSVRDAAQKAINSRLNPAYCSSFITNLALIARLEATAKVHSEQFVKGIKELLQRAECQSGLTEALSSSDRFIRRASFRLAINSKGRNLSEVLRQALNYNDTVIRLWAAQSVSAAFEGAALDKMLTLMKRDRFMPVRREALRHPDRKRAELRSALLDAHASIREEARYHVSQFDSFDVASFYRQGLTSGDQLSLPSAISGLGETGVAEDGDLPVPYASHNAAKIRRAAIKALARLNSEARLDVLIQALMDQFPSVSREAIKGLADKATLIGKGRLWEIFSSTSHSHVKRNALSLLEKIVKWDSIYFLVKSTSESDQSVASRALIAIDRWLWRFNRTFPVPTPDQLIKLSRALEECGDHLDEKTSEQLWFCMKGF